MMRNLLAAPTTEPGLSGDWSTLAAHLGSPTTSFNLQNAADFLGVNPVKHRDDLRAFLEAYQAQILVPLELPTVQRAFRHASRNETRELIAFDLDFANETLPAAFRNASQRVGGAHLHRLRTLRDVRLLQRYRKAVESGEAHGWHTMVFGTALSVYSLPVRQGLRHYERQTLGGFLRAASPALGLTQIERSKLLNELCAELGDTCPPLSGESDRDTDVPEW